MTAQTVVTPAQSAPDQPTPPLSPDEHAAMRADIRRLGALLGQTLVRQEGQQLLDLVERVRLLVREDRSAAAGLLESIDVPTAARLVRAFGTYFHLANITEQVHRGRELRRRRAAEGGWLAQAVAAVAVTDRATLTAELARLAVRPVFTAHPTEAARRTVLTKLRQVADLLERDDDPRTERRLAEVVELLWQTDELRLGRPDVVDEARNAIYYFDELHAVAVPDVLEELVVQLREIGVDVPVDARPLSFGTWIGGDRDGNPNVSPEVTYDVLRLQHDHGLRDALAVVDELRADLSSSTRIAGASPELLASVERDIAALPVEQRYRRLNAE